MAVKTTAAAGNYNSGATWVGGVKPVAGVDTAVIAHDVDVTTAEDLGTSPIAGTVVLTLSTGKLTIKNGGTLIVRGDISVADVPFEVQAGGILEFNAASAATPATTRYKCTIGSANNQGNSYFVTTGVAGVRAIVRSNAGGAAGYFAGGVTWTRGGKAKLQWTQFTRIGDGTNYGFNFDLNSSALDQFFADNCIFDNCGGINNGGGAIKNGALFRLNHSTWVNSGANLLNKFGSNDTLGTGTRRVTFCVFDKQVQIYAPLEFTIEDNYFDEVPDCTTAAWTSWKRNFVRITGGGTFLSQATRQDNYWLYDDTLINPHFTQPDGSGISHDMIDDIYEFTGTDGQGDTVLAPSPAVAKLYRIIRPIILPNAAGLQSGTMLDCLGNANVQFEVDHPTAFANYAAIVVGEGAGFVGMVTKVKNGLYWGPVAAAGFIIDDDTANVTDQVTPANANFNHTWRIATGIKGVGYNSPMSTSPGANDTSGDPQFIDSTRNLAKWDLSLGGPGTVANARAELKKLNNDSGYNSNYNYTALAAYIRTGFMPRAGSVRASAEDGSTKGAVQFTGSTGGSSRRRRRL